MIVLKRYNISNSQWELDESATLELRWHEKVKYALVLFFSRSDGILLNEWEMITRI